jgi:hypothetical protein
MYDAAVNKQVPVFYSRGLTGICMTAIAHPVLRLQCNTESCTCQYCNHDISDETAYYSDILIIILILFQ